MATVVNPYIPQLEALKQCVQDALERYERPVGRAFIAPGAEVADDDCCEGQLSVRLTSNFPTGPFPSRDVSVRCHPLMWAPQIEVQVMRCAHVVDDNGNAPTAAQLTTDATGVLDDMVIVQEAISCCWATEDMKVLIDTWVPQGPRGGCAGGLWTVWLAMPSCACPEVE